MKEERKYTMGNNIVKHFVHVGEKWPGKFSINRQAVIFKVRFNPENNMGTVIGPPEAVQALPGLLRFVIHDGWLECSGPDRVLSPEEFQEFALRLLFEKVFESVGLPEIMQGELNDLYTNDMMFHQMHDYPNEFFAFGVKLEQMTGSHYEKRSWLCNQIDALLK